LDLPQVTLTQAKPPITEIHRLTIERREDETVLICLHCDRPFLVISDGELRITEKHGSAKHENTLTADDLRMVAVEMYRQTHPPMLW
jgi:hypothetical protein